MIDLYGRNIDYLRVSITDRCNLHCRYCLPPGLEAAEKDRERYEQYTAAMLEVARLKAVPVLDMYHHGLMNPCIPAIKALRMPDGAHMTLAGLELYTAQIIGFLRQVGALGD